MRKICIPCTGIPRKLQHLHAGEPGLLHKFTYFIGNDTQILRDNRQLLRPKVLIQRTEQRHARALDPLAVLSRLITIRYRIISFKSPEMIHPERVVQVEAVADPVNPPLEACYSMLLPVIQRISPQLPCRAECIWRHACNAGRISILIILKQLPVCPHIRGIRRTVNRDISQDLYTPDSCVVMNLLPLLPELHLHKRMKSDLVLMLSGECFHRCLIMVS